MSTIQITVTLGQDLGGGRFPEVLYRSPDGIMRPLATRLTFHQCDACGALTEVGMASRHKEWHGEVQPDA
jgi:hypothetical protein